MKRASVFANAVHRRLHEHVGTRTTPWWRSPYILPSAFQTNSRYFEEEAALWEWGAGVKMPVLATGNLTEKKLGRTADWLMVTEFDNPALLRELMVTQHGSAHEVYDRAAEAADSESPCSDVTSDTDLLIMVGAMAAAACGGSQAIAQSFHTTSRWIGLTWVGVGPAQVASGRRRFLPSYELWLVAVWLAASVICYYPAVDQLQKEKAVADFSVSSVNMVVRYGAIQVLHFLTHEQEVVPRVYGGRPALITLVHATSHCTEQRMLLIAGLFGAGVVFGFLANIPFFFRARAALKRYMRGIRFKERRPVNHSWVTDARLTLFDSSPTAVATSEPASPAASSTPAAAVVPVPGPVPAVRGAPAEFSVLDTGD